MLECVAMFVFGLHRFVAYGIHPFQYVGALHLNSHADADTVLLAIQTQLCYPLGASASFCGWGRAATTLCLRSDDVTVNDVPIVVLVSLDSTFHV